MDELSSKVKEVNVQEGEAVPNGTSSSMKRDINSKRSDYLEWTDNFMAKVFLAAKKNKDPCTQVGACIVNKDKRIVGLGYNGMPQNCSDDVFPWKKETDSKLDSKYLYDRNVCHAEMNAIWNKNSADLKDCTIYVAVFPCTECAKMIIQSGIKEVLYLSDKHKDNVGVLYLPYEYKDNVKKVLDEYKADKETATVEVMFDAFNVKHSQYIPKKKQIRKDLDDLWQPLCSTSKSKSN